jgi:dihydropteroate synthase
MVATGGQVAPPVLRGRGYTLVLDRPRIMGILNLTPDSFSDGGCYTSCEAALHRAAQMVAEGVDLIDIGGESTRPGAATVSAEVEIERVVPVIEALRSRFDLPLSIDTTKSCVASAALAAGADFVNDISGLTFDPELAKVVAQHRAGLFLMHTSGRPDLMQQRTTYRDLLGEIIVFLRSALERARSAGIPDEALAIDPGIGFGKTLSGNLEILRRLGELKVLELPILLGTSRKRFIGEVLDLPDPLERQSGTLATVALGVAAGALLLRVHEVRPAREAALMSWAIINAKSP